jgi:hypothetical protein
MTLSVHFISMLVGERNLEDWKSKNLKMKFRSRDVLPSGVWSLNSDREA